LALLVIVVASASGLEVQEASVPGTVWEINRGAHGDVYASNLGLGQIWHIGASGAYTVYENVPGVYDARPDAAGNIWFTDGALSFGRIDVVNNRETLWTLVGAGNLGGLALDGTGKVWIVEYVGAHLYRFDPATTRVCTYTLDAYSDYLVQHDGQLWWGSSSGHLYRLDPATNQVTGWGKDGLSLWPRGLGVDDEGGLWWADLGQGALARLQPGLDLMTAYNLPSGTKPQMIAIRPDGVWYTEYTNGAAGTFGVLRPDQTTGTATPLTRTGPSPVTPECPDQALDPEFEDDVVPTTGQLTWSAESYAPIVDDAAWTVFQVPTGLISKGPYGIADSGGVLWIGDQGRQKVLRLVEESKRFKVYLPLILR
jgi:streptogramin lyase